MESRIPGPSNIIFPKMITARNAIAIPPMHILKSRDDGTRDRGSGLSDIPFLQLLGRSERFSSHEQDTNTESMKRKAIFKLVWSERCDSPDAQYMTNQRPAL
jgi:hypothetical protein